MVRLPMMFPMGAKMLVSNEDMNDIMKSNLGNHLSSFILISAICAANCISGCNQKVCTMSRTLGTRSRSPVILVEEGMNSLSNDDFLLPPAFGEA